MEREQEYIKGPFHLIRCAWEIGILALGELLDKMDDALDVWPEEYDE